MKIRLHILLLLLFCFHLSNGQKNSNSTNTEDSKFKFYYYEAIKQKMLGNYSDAINYYLESLKVNEESSASMFEISRLLYSSGDVNGSIKLLEKAVKISPDNIWYNIFLAELYKSQKDLKSAIKVYENITALYPLKTDYTYELINLYTLSGKLSSAEKLFDQIESEYGIGNRLLEEKIKFYIVQNEFDDVISNLKILINNNPEEPKYLNILSETYIQIKEYDKALETLNILKEFDDYKTISYFNIAAIYSTIGDNEKYVHSLISLFRQKEFDVNDKIEIYVNEIALSKDTLVLTVKDTLIKSLVYTHSDKAKPHLLYADYLIQKKDYLGAKRELYSFIKLDKTNYLAYEQLLYLENMDSNYDSVLSISSEAMALYPNQAMLYFYNGYSKFQLESYSGAISIFNDGLLSVTKQELRLQFYLYIAESYYKIDNKIEAYNQFEKLLRIDPTNSMALNNYSYYLSLDNKDLKKALEMSIIANDLEKDNFIYLDTYAWILYKMEQYTKAKEKIEDAIRLGGDSHSEILEHYGDILFKLNDRENALLQWNNALLLDETNIKLIEKINTSKINE